MRASSPLVLALAALTTVGCQVRQPGKFERWTAHLVKSRLTIGDRKKVNPLAATADNIHVGERTFQAYCSSCHGPDGESTGVVFADKMSPPVPHLDSPEVQSYSDGQLHNVIKNGIYPSGMPSWKDSLTDEEMWAIVLYLRQLPRPPSAR